MTQDEYLEHYGIKGMRWGIRRTPEQLGHKPRTSTEKWKVRQLNKIDALYNKSYKKLDKAYKEDPVDPSIMKYKKELQAQQKKDRKQIADMSFVQVEQARSRQRAERNEKIKSAFQTAGGAAMWTARMALIGVRIGGTVAALNVLSDAGRTAMDFLSSQEGQELIHSGSKIITDFGNGELTAPNVVKRFVGVKLPDTSIDKALSSIDVESVMPGANYVPPEVMATSMKEVSNELRKLH